MTRKGATVPVRLEALGNGTGDNALVWVPDGLDPANPPAPAAPASEVPTNVTVSNVLVNGAAQSFSYSVTPFDPSRTGADTVVPTITGPAQPVAGAPNTYAFNPVPGATGYHWSASSIVPFTLNLDAENGPGDVTITPAGTNLIATGVAATGLASYHFNSYPPETMTANTPFVPTAGATLSFASEFLYASASETAHAQISDDGGVSWTDLYTITGSGGETESSFATHTVDLSAYTGQTCSLRFAFDYNGTGQYFLPGLNTGWFVDDIQIIGAQTIAAVTGGDLAAGVTQFTFSPGSTGAYALQAIPVFYGQYPADAGPLLVVSAIGLSTGINGSTVTVAATVPRASASGEGVFTLTRTGDLSQAIKVHYSLKGAVNGTDYALLPGSVKIKSGKASATVNLVPTASAVAGKVKMILQPGGNYTVGSPSSAVVKIAP